MIINPQCPVDLVAVIIPLINVIVMELTFHKHPPIKNQDAKMWWSLTWSGLLLQWSMESLII